MKYNGYSVGMITKLFEIGKQHLGAYATLDAVEKIANPADPWAQAIVEAGERFGDEIDKLEEKTYYRIGEPRICHMNDVYYPSHNFAEDRNELGVSVATEAWLHNLKSVFFGAAEGCKTKGVWEIKGVLIGFGGDDEPLIVPTDWAKKTRVRSLSGLAKLVREK